MDVNPISQYCIQPDLEADIASILLARLEGLFDRKTLSLHDGAPRNGSFIARLGEPSFWICAMCEDGTPRYTPAMQFYLRRLFPESAYMRFCDYSRVWAQSFHATRHNRDSARDMLLLFLTQNLHYLKRVYILEQPHNRTLAPNAEALERCFDTPANATLFVGSGFSRWVLEDWLPFHLRTMCCDDYRTHETMLLRQAAPQAENATPLRHSLLQ